MRLRIRQLEEDRQLCEAVTVDVISEIIPLETMQAVIVDCQVHEQRRRKLPALLTLLTCIAMHVFSEVSLKYVLMRLVHGTRLLSGQGAQATANKSAISEARYRLGSEVLERLFRQVCRPIATRATVGAFAYGLRVVALDGSLEDVADTALNAAHFGRPSNAQGPGAFPQARTAYLCECGTHVIFDAVVGRYTDDEHVACRHLLRSVQGDMLVTLDKGLCDFETLSAIQSRGAQFLARLPDGTRPQYITSLPDGSSLAWLRPSDYRHRQAGERLLVRVIRYTLDDPARPHHAQVHRLVTTLLDPLRYAALDLICLYHERWEIEITIDEIDTHQRLSQYPLRSLKPVGVLQELFALLIAHFLIRVIMHRAATASQLDPDRLSFVNSLRLVADAIPDFQLITPADHPALWQRLLNDILHFQLPPRDNRINPRVVKRQRSKFPPKRPSHLACPQPTRSFRDCVVLLC